MRAAWLHQTAPITCPQATRSHRLRRRSQPSVWHRPAAADPARADSSPGPAPQKPNNYDVEIGMLAIPALAALAADPVASLCGTAFVGRLGATPLAAVGTALSVQGAFTKLLNVPLLSVTTSRVASAVGAGQGRDGSSVSTETSKACSAALLVALLVGLAQAGVLLALAGQGLSAWGAGPTSPLRADALTYLQVRAIGSPATVLFLVAQGAFRGLGDTRTPLYATLVSTVLSLGLDVLLIFTLGLGVAGAAWATVLAEGFAGLALVGALQQRRALVLPSRGDLSRLTGFAGPPSGGDLSRLTDFAGPVGILALRTAAIAGTFAVATATAARIDVPHAAGHQICLQLWLASSLLADALAVAAQALVARLLAAKDSINAQVVARRTVSLAGILGLILGVGMALTSDVVPRLFNPSADVLAALRPVYPFIILTQPLNALAFVLDGVLYGANGFAYAARAMPLCAAPAIACMLVSQALGSPDARLSAVWVGLTVLMGMRAVTILLPWRLNRGPFKAFKDVKLS